MSLDPNKIGVRVDCTVCGRTKKPIGRSAPVETYLCDDDCVGYNQEPRVGSLWPNESEADFGYYVGQQGAKWR